MKTPTPPQAEDCTDEEKDKMLENGKAKVVAEIDLSNSDHGYTLPTAKWREKIEEFVNQCSVDMVAMKEMIEDLVEKALSQQKKELEEQDVTSDAYKIGFTSGFQKGYKKAKKELEDKHQKEMEEERESIIEELSQFAHKKNPPDKVQYLFYLDELLEDFS